MSIQTVGGIQEILGKYDSKAWSKSAELSGIDDFQWSKELEGVNPKSGVENKATFGEFLANSIGEVNSLQHKANESIQRLVTGENKNLHETMLTVEKAEIAFKTMNQVRQKVLDAYREVMKMQV